MQKIWETYGNIWEKIIKWWFIDHQQVLWGPLFEEADPYHHVLKIAGFRQHQHGWSILVASSSHIFSSWRILYPLHPMVFVNDWSATGSDFAQPTQNWQNQSRCLGWKSSLKMEDPIPGGFPHRQKKYHGFTDSSDGVPEKVKAIIITSTFLGHNSIIILVFSGKSMRPTSWSYHVTYQSPSSLDLRRS